VGERALLSNARCLAEGIDVPTLDGVAFIDPRRSEVDIIQAVGRAIRKAPDKKIGTIILPVFIEASDEPEQVLEGSAFKPVWDVVRALRSHDEELAEKLDGLRRALGRKGSTGRLPAKIVVDLPTAVGVKFAEQFSARLVDATTASWEYLFGMLEAFVAREGHARVPNSYVEADVNLGSWVGTQRIFYTRGRLSPARIARLEALPGWSWDPIADKWEANFALLEQFVAREGHARVPQGYVENNVQLGDWLSNLRQRGRKKGRLSADQIAGLEALPGWTWDPRAAQWEETFALLEQFVAREGRARVPQGYVENNVELGGWLSNLRNLWKKGRLSADQIARLEALPGWSWDPIADKWEANFALLEQFVAREDHTQVPQDHVEDGVRLGNWVTKQQGLYRDGRLTATLVTRLETLPGWRWSRYPEQSEDYFALLERYVAREGHARVPQVHVEGGKQLGTWVGTQRGAYKEGRSSEREIARLEALPGWS
jgi:hypothetical protein